MRFDYDVIVIGGGHAGVEAAWAASQALGGKWTCCLGDHAAGSNGSHELQPGDRGACQGPDGSRN